MRTFSFISLLTILALAFVVPSAIAQKEFKVTITQRSTPIYMLDAAALGTDALTVDLDIEFAEPVGDILATGSEVVTVEHELDGDGIKVASSTLPAIAEVTDFPMRSGKKRRVTITITPQAAGTAAPDDAMGLVEKLIVKVGSTMSTNTDLAAKDKANMSKETYHTITVVQPIPANTSRPMVVSVQRLRPGSQAVVSAFEEAEVAGAFDVRIVFTEMPHDFKVGHIEVDGGTASNLVVGKPFARSGTGLTTVVPHPLEGGYSHNLPNVPGAAAAGTDLVPGPTGADMMYHQYRVTITPHRRADMVKVSVKEFHDNAAPYPNVYKPFNVEHKPNGREQLRLAVDTTTTALEAGFKLYLPHSEGAQITYSGGTAGHYILTRDKDGSGIQWFHEKDDENNAHKQTPAQLLYNTRVSDKLPNLLNFLTDGGTIDLVAYDGKTAGSAYISEIMWGTDASQEPATKSQWIEIRNGTTAAIGIGENKWALWFYQANETPSTTYVKEDGTTGVLIDRVSTKDATTGIKWPLTNRGQSGRTGIDPGEDIVHTSPRQKLISMYRVLDATGTPEDGTMKSSWMPSTSSVNFKLGIDGQYSATPGALPIITAEQLAAAEKKKTDAAAAAKAKADAAAAKAAATATYPMGNDGRVYISEVMFAGGGTLPQWIEIANGDRSKKFNLSGWTITVDNAAADADVDVSSATFTIPDGTEISPSAQKESPSTLLVVTERGRNSLDATGAMASGQVINLSVDNETELILAGVVTGKYTLLSDMAFLITLAPPEPEPVKAPAGETKTAKAQRQAAEKTAKAMRIKATDMAGNLGTDGAAAWALPMSESGARSSIIRKHIQVTRGPAAPEDGKMMESWALAAETSFAQVTHIRASSYYGAANDVGTPGFRAGGALPVELSHFRPARDKVTDAVVITWATESELNNAGFFIKRSQQKDGEFKVVNAAMIPGAGTTSEKQFYTYTDTTAQPNVVYYYQIEDVSLDGNRQTLTRGIRLKGHVGAAGKATVIWGELKTSHE